MNLLNIKNNLGQKEKEILSCNQEKGQLQTELEEKEEAIKDNHDDAEALQSEKVQDRSHQ